MSSDQSPVRTGFRRYCKTITLRNDPALIAEYTRVHERQYRWPEIDRGMREVGILRMEIYISGVTLFMIMDVVPEFDHDRDMRRLADLPRQREWEAYVAQFQSAPGSATADEKWKVMECIYSLE